MSSGKVYLLQHVAASGGTVFTRAVSTIPGTVVLSEVHPDRNLPSRFDPIWQFVSSYGLLRADDMDDLYDNFLESINFIHSICQRESRALVIRDHFHHDFMKNRASRTFEILSKRYEVCRIYLARDPLDVWIAWRERGWCEDLKLSDFLVRWRDCWNQYSNEDTDVRISYEGFCKSPRSSIEPIAHNMGRIWSERLLKNLYSRGNMTGSSGRDGGEISIRRTQYELLAFADVEHFAASVTYQKICDEMGYLSFIKRDIPKVWRRQLGLPDI